MVFTSAAQLWASLMIRDPILLCDAPWFNPNEVCSFLVAEYLDGNGTSLGHLSFDQILYAKWQRRCTFSIEELVRVRRQWSRGAWVQGPVERPRRLGWLS